MGQLLAESPALHHGPPPGQTDQGKCVKHTFSSESFPCFGLMSVGPAASAALHHQHAVLCCQCTACSLCSPAVVPLEMS